MKDKSLSPDLDKIEFLPDAENLTEAAVRAAARLAPLRKGDAAARPIKPRRKASRNAD